MYIFLTDSFVSFILLQELLKLNSLIHIQIMKKFGHRNEKSLCCRDEKGTLQLSAKAKALFKEKEKRKRSKSTAKP